MRKILRKNPQNPQRSTRFLKIVNFLTKKSTKIKKLCSKSQNFEKPQICGFRNLGLKIRKVYSNSAVFAENRKVWSHWTHTLFSASFLFFYDSAVAPFGGVHGRPGGWGGEATSIYVVHMNRSSYETRNQCFMRKGLIFIFCSNEGMLFLLLHVRRFVLENT